MRVFLWNIFRTWLLSKKGDNVNIFWTLNLVLTLLGYPNLNGGVAPSLCAFRCQVKGRLTTRYIISTTLIDCIYAFVCTCIKWVEILLLFILYVTHPVKFWANEMGDTNLGFLQPYKEPTVFAKEISLLPSPQQHFTKYTTTAFLSCSQSKINQYILQYESQQLINKNINMWKHYSLKHTFDVKGL